MRASECIDYVVDMHDDRFGVGWEGWVGKLTLDQLNSLQTWTDACHVKSVDVRQAAGDTEEQQVSRSALGSHKQTDKRIQN